MNSPSSSGSSPSTHAFLCPQYPDINPTNSDCIHSTPDLSDLMAMPIIAKRYSIMIEYREDYGAKSDQ